VRGGVVDRLEPVHVDDGERQRLLPEPERTQPAFRAAPVAETGERVLQGVPAEHGRLPLGLPQAAAAHEHLRPQVAAAGVRAAGVGAVGLQPVQGLGGATERRGVPPQLQQALPVAAPVTRGREGARRVDQHADGLLAALAVVVALREPGQEPRQHEVGVGPQPDPAGALHVPADPPQRAEGVVEVARADQRPRVHDVQEVVVAGVGFVGDVAGGGGRRDRLDGQVGGAGGVAPAELGLGQLDVLAG
jgi:hypothetical protein